MPASASSGGWPLQQPTHLLVYTEACVVLVTRHVSHPIPPVLIYIVVLLHPNRGYPDQKRHHTATLGVVPELVALHKTPDQA